MQPAPPPPPPVTSSPKTAQKPASRTPKLALLVLVFLGVAFAAGYVPQMLRANRAEEQLATTSLDLELARAHRILGNAALEAQRHNFANAGTAAAAFFNRCAELSRDPALANEPRTRIALAAYAQQRDEIMVQIASGDIGVAQRLSSLYFTMDGVIARRE